MSQVATRRESLALVLVAGIYVGFAVQDCRAETLATEGALAFVAAALAGL